VKTEIMKTTTFISLGKGKARKESAKSSGEQEKIYSIRHLEGSEADSKDALKEAPLGCLSHYEIIEISLLYDTADLLLTKLRDEAHRFSNRYRTKRMSKERQ
jgi:hypothetical protein